jgi:hypothetical protein
LADPQADQRTCVDCQQPADKSYGTLWLCQHCWWNELCRILTKRPDLRAPTGIGYPVADYLKCDTCHGEWFGQQAGEPCPHCERYVIAKEELQAQLDRERFTGYLQRLREGDRAALAPAINLARRVPHGQRKLARIMAGWGAA